MWALWYKLEDESPQLSFDFDSTAGWVGPLMWPDARFKKKALNNFYKSLPGKNVQAQIRGKFVKKGDVWQLILLK